MTGPTPIDTYLAELTRSLGWRRHLERRALAELRDHLECSVQAHRREGMTETEAQAAALEALGTVEQSWCAVVDSNKALTVLQLAKDRLLVLACLLTLPGVLLLGLSFLTFNFPCSSVEVGVGPTSYVYERCGLPFLQSLRPWISEFGLYGTAAWYQVTQFALTTLGPLAAAVLLLAGQTRIRVDRDGGAAATLVVVKPAAHRMVALVTATGVFVAVAAYKLAG